MKVRYIKIIRIGKNIRIPANHAILDTNTLCPISPSPQTILHNTTQCPCLHTILDTWLWYACSINHSSILLNCTDYVLSLTSCVLAYTCLLRSTRIAFIIRCISVLRLIACCVVLLLRSAPVQVYKLVWAVEKRLWVWDAFTRYY